MLKKSTLIQGFVKPLCVLGLSVTVLTLFTGCGGDPYLKDKYAHLLEEKNALVEERFPLHQEVNELRTGYFELGKDFASTRTVMSQMEEQLQATDGRMQTVLDSIGDRTQEDEHAKRMMTEVTNRVQQLEKRFDVLVKSTDDILRVVRGHREGPTDVKGIGKKKSLSSIHTQPSSSKKIKKTPEAKQSESQKTEKRSSKSEQAGTSEKKS
ncbi:MAG: hypothetical protein NPIRA04_05450 [Nitrospirales bacterium]|nr:MAG: hypothetical protein NPIRA04_05450 [Nitrospirales bacterium]